MNKPVWEDVLAFWLSTPAGSADELMQKIRRWYQGSPALDLEIDTRFGHLVERATTGVLESWTATPRGALALIIVLDQFARNIHRGTPRAHAGDARALALALELHERGGTAAMSLEEQLFAMMPLVHAEDLTMQDRAVELAERLASAAPSEDLRGGWSIGAARTRHYRDVIRRFGRFPHRNRALGRASTDAELKFLREEEQKPAPV